ncbi:MAG: hypothetical protein ABI333_09930 [bacterium]
MRSRLFRVWLRSFTALTLTAAFTLGLGTAPAYGRKSAAAKTSQLTATCKVHVIQGQHAPGRFPKALQHLRRRLDAQPFKVFRSFALLKVTSLRLSTGQLSSKKLVGPYRLEGQLLSQLLSAKHRRRLRFELALYRRRTRFRAAKRLLKSTLVLDRGGTMFLAGPPHKGGKLILGLTCR